MTEPNQINSDVNNALYRNRMHSYSFWLFNRKRVRRTLCVDKCGSPKMITRRINTYLILPLKTYKVHKSLAKTAFVMTDD